MSRIIGLDLSLTSTGFSVLGENGKSVDGGNFGYALREADERQKIERMLYIANQIIGVVKKYSIEEKPSVAVEGYAFGKMYKREALAELQGVVKTQLFLALGIVVCPIPPSAARKLVGLAIRQRRVRKKNAGQWVEEKRKNVGKVKEQVREQLAERGIYFSTEQEDMMDAYVVARALWCKNNSTD